MGIGVKYVWVALLGKVCSQRNLPWGVRISQTCSCRLVSLVRMEHGKLFWELRRCGKGKWFAKLVLTDILGWGEVFRNRASLNRKIENMSCDAYESLPLTRIV